MAASEAKQYVETFKDVAGLVAGFSDKTHRCIEVYATVENTTVGFKCRREAPEIRSEPKRYASCPPTRAFVNMRFSARGFASSELTNHTEEALSVLDLDWDLTKTNSELGSQCSVYCTPRDADDVCTLQVQSGNGWRDLDMSPARAMLKFFGRSVRWHYTGD